MELKKKYIHMNCEKGRALSQITLDDDYNLPDYKPDIVKIMKDRGEIRFDEIKVSDGHLYIKGTLNFSVLYRSEQDEKKIDSLSGSVPFMENISIDGAAELDPVEMEAEIEDLTIGVINSRKLSVRALVMLKACIRETRDEAVATDVGSDGELEMQKENRDILQLLECKKDNFRFRKEIPLASSKPNIREILWRSVQVRGLESRLKNGEIELIGEILVYVLYLGEEDEERLQWIETTVPLTGSVECGNCEENSIYRVSVSQRSNDIEVKPDYDGEMRILNLDMVLDLDICLWKEENMEILKDVYSLSKRVVPEYEQGVLPYLVAKNYAKCKIGDRIQLDGEQENILQICICEGTVNIENTEYRPEGVNVEGTLSVEVMYITTDDAMPVGTLKGLIGFEQLIEAPGADPETEFELEAGIEQLGALLVDNTQVEVKAVVNLNLIAFENRKVEKLVSVREEGENLEELQRRPGIVGYIVKPGDSLWNIAKENHTTMAELAAMNQLSSEEIETGDKLLIVKKV